MKKKYYLILLFLCIISLDQLTKYLSYSYLPLEGLNLFLFQLKTKFNYGISAGFFSKANPIFVTLFHALTGFTLIPIFLSLIYFLPKNMFRLKCGMIILLSGILSNVLDKINHGAVIDFISITKTAIFFNFADLFILFSLGLIVSEIFFSNKKQILKDSRRKQMMINPQFQMKFILIIIGFMACFFMASTVLLFVFYFMMSSMIPSEYFNRSDLLIGLSFQFLAFINFSILAYFFFKKFGHSIAGPIYALKKFVLDYNTNEKASLHLREHDEFKKELKEIASLIKKNIN